MRQVLSFFLGGAFLVAAVAWLLWRPGTRGKPLAVVQPSSESIPADASPEPTPGTPTSAVLEPESLGPAEDGTSRSRVPSDGALGRALRVLTSTDDGEPLEGAEVSAHSQSGGPVLVERSDSHGTAALRVDPRARAIAIWASHPRARATLHRLARNDEHLPERVEIRLGEGEPLRVRVLDGLGNGVPDAQVEQRFVSPTAALAGGELRHPGQQAGVDWVDLAGFERRYTTGTSGWVDAHPASLALQLVARRGDLASRPRIVGPSEREVVLVLRSEARALGRVHLSVDPTAVGELNVCVLERAPGLGGEGDLRVLGVGKVATDGTWGPVALASDPSQLLHFRLSGGRVIPEERVLDPRVHAPPYVVDFAPELGHPLSVRVFTREGDVQRAVPGARVEFRHLRPMDGRIAQVLGWTDAEGRALLGGCPETTGTVVVQASGLAAAEVRPVGLPRTVDLDVELAPAGVLFGRCTHRGSPVHDFDIHVWQKEPRDRSLFSFRDRPDGSYQLSGAPLGRVQVLASSPVHPECQIQTIDVDARHPRELDFELPDSVVGRGRVVDSQGGAPIASARVRPLITVSDLQVGERGPVFSVDADGRFELRAFPPKDTGVLVEAEGFARKRVQASLDRDHGIDFGEIALTRAQPLEVRLLGLGSFDASTLWFLAQGPTSIPFTRFPKDGQLFFPEVESGAYMLYVAWQDGSNVTRLVDLVGGRRWSFDFELDPGRDLRIEIVDKEGRPPAEVLSVFVLSVPQEGCEVTRSCETDEQGVALIQAFAPQSFVVEVRDAGDATLLVQAVDLSGIADRNVRLTLRDRSLHVLALDAKGEPLPGTLVELTEPGPAAFWSIDTMTDARGVVELHGIGFDRVLLGMRHPSAGSVSNRIVQISPRGRTEVEFVLDGGEELRVLVMDENRPMPGLTLELSPSVRAIFMGARESDAQGVALWNLVQPGRYQVLVNGAGFWPSWHALELREGGEVHPIEALRLGDLLLRLRDAEGHALPGLAVEAIALELGESVSSWAAARRIHARPADLRTDYAGELRLQGIPRGPYKLSIQTPAGEWVERELRVPGGRLLEELIVLE